MISGIPESAFIIKPSDVLMVCILLRCTLFFLWVLLRGSKISDAGAPNDTSEDADETETPNNTEEVSLDPGCFFVGQGYIAVVILIAIGMALVWWFQVLHPGR